ncbi:gluconate 2-dehydrogenase subunit 3 family protein [Pseudomonas sp. PSKL.D1]|uniref:gluconate 2-dehydrogenase subunit 3 family protein n=1 Tax=Pseudomonas sp. PSKL.D1 TaxID=3029060 RepID=UPI0023810AAF|nr:gluconate 2-dehydrogenase subunit 3 family protein [Pseudomonas sp. PSKL.D1]WDY55801.1 gluconate 2-dehydrogenase subunit 3 family protein [Pseudomonas sp. PSKL.D1]
MSQQDQEKPYESRRTFFKKTLTLIPLTVVATQLPGLVDAAPAEQAQRPAANPDSSTAYSPVFFNELEWAFILAACARLIPQDELGAGAVEAGVPEFIDRHMQSSYAAGDIWYLQGPYYEASPEFGYQGKLPPRDILRVGISALDAWCKKERAGKPFAALATNDQDDILKKLEAGEIKTEGVPGKVFFTHLLNETLYGFFSDPQYGGNKDMVGWKLVGYPGVRADYMDWVDQTSKPYPLPPVSMSGRRG